MDLADVPRGETGPLVREVPEQVGGGRDPAGLLGDQSYPLADPWIFYELARLPFQAGQYGADRGTHTGDDRGSVRIHQLCELIPIAAAERTHLDGRHLPGLQDAINPVNLRRPLPVRYIQNASKPASKGVVTRAHAC